MQSIARHRHRFAAMVDGLAVEHGHDIVHTVETEPEGTLFGGCHLMNFLIGQAHH